MWENINSHQFQKETQELMQKIEESRKTEEKEERSITITAKGGVDIQFKQIDGGTEVKLTVPNE